MLARHYPRRYFSATVTRVAAATTSTQLLAANTRRLTAIFYNDSTADLYLKFGTAASATSKTVTVAPGDTYELPGPPIYGDIIHGLWTAATGAVDITEGG